MIDKYNLGNPLFWGKVQEKLAKAEREARAVNSVQGVNKAIKNIAFKGEG